MTLETVQEMKAAHRTLAEFSYPVPKVHRGYAGQTLYVNVATGQIEARPVTEEMKRHLRRRQGVRPVAAVARGDRRDAVERPRERDRHRLRPHRRHHALPRHRQVAGRHHLAADPHRRGQQRRRLLRPAAQVRRLGRARGPGQGRRGCHRLHRRRHGPRDHRRGAAGSGRHATRWPSSSPRCTPKDESDRRNVSVVSAGQGSEHTRIGCLNVSWYDPRAARRASSRPAAAASAPCCATSRSRRSSCRYTGIKADSNDPADIKRIRAVGQRINKEIVELDDEQNRMRTRGHGAPGRDHGRLRPAAGAQLPVRLRTPTRPRSTRWSGTRSSPRASPTRCFYGCTMACSKGVDGFQVRTGPVRRADASRWTGRSTRPWPACGSNLGIFDPPRHHRAELLLRHLRHRHHLLRHADRLRHGVLRGGHPGQGEDRRAGAALRQRRRRARAAAPDGARRGLRRDRGHGRARA